MLIATIFDAVFTVLTTPKPMRTARKTSDYLKDMEILDAALTCKEHNIRPHGPHLWRVDALTKRFTADQLLHLYRRAESHWVHSNPLCHNYPRSSKVQILTR